MATKSDSSAESESEVSSNYAASRRSSAATATRTSGRTNTESIVESTAWLAPTQPARRSVDGKHIRPAGRPPVDGYRWNTLRGVWVPGVRLLSEMEAQMSLQHKRPYNRRRGDPNAARNSALRRKKAQRATDHDEYLGSDLDIDEPRMPVEQRKPPPKSSSNVSSINKLSQQNDPHDELKGEAVPKHKPDDTDLVEAANTSGGDDNDIISPQQQKPPARKRSFDNPSVDSPFHPSSAWQEPPPDDDEPDLTLFEKHRSARPAPTGSFACSIKALRQEFRCVICLDFIRNARIVRECLHRFCEHCIEKALVQVGRRRECPICRVRIPSRRSLAPDPNFDKLIHRILRNLVSANEGEDDDMVSPPPAVGSPPSRILQQAIQQKKQSADEELVRQLQGDVASELEGDGVEAEASPTTELQDEISVPEKSPGETAVPALIKLLLLRHEEEKHLDELRQPFLSIAGDAPVRVLKTFLRQKHGFSTNSFEIWSILHGQPNLLDDSITLQTVATDMTDVYEGSYTPLYYRGI